MRVNTRCSRPRLSDRFTDDELAGEGAEAGAGAIEALVTTTSGALDEIVDGDMRREITRINPQVSVAVIAGAGHSTRRDRSDEFHAIADRWIAERFADARSESASL